MSLWVTVRMDDQGTPVVNIGASVDYEHAERGEAPEAGGNIASAAILTPVAAPAGLAELLQTLMTDASGRVLRQARREATKAEAVSIANVERDALRLARASQEERV